MERQIPLIYLHGIVPGRYMASSPVYIVGDDPANLAFSVAVDDQACVIPFDGAVLAQQTRGF